MSEGRSKPKARSGAARKAREGSAEGWLRIRKREVELLRSHLREAQETLEAIRGGEVDALVVNGPKGSQVYSLSGAEQPYRIYVERMQEGAVTVGADGTVLYSNQRFAEMADSPLDRVIGCSIAEFIAPEVWERLQGVLRGEEFAVKYEESLRRGKAEPLPVNFTASRLPLHDQEVLCLVVTDLTEQKDKAGLHLAKEIAEKASSAKDAFLAALSHELRTPLTPALMAATVLEEDPSLPEQVRKSVAMIRHNVELEARLIDDLLDLTRISQGKLELRLAPMDLHAALRRGIEISQADLTAKRQQLAVELEARAFSIQGDSVRILQAIWNLLRNAVKFAPPGGKITLRTGNRGPEAVWIEVRDSGIGFDRETASRMFLAFEQGSRYITRQFGGLGLGLAITRSIVEAHGGTIRGESPGPGLGASFTIELPVASSASAPPPAPDRAPPARSRVARRILLVEDHADTRASMERFLSRAGHEVFAVQSASQASALAERQKFDLVISDLGLTDQSGLDLMRELRQRHDLHGIAVSGYGMEDDIARSRAAGFSHHLTKPISLRALASLLEAWEAKPAGRS